MSELCRITDRETLERQVRRSVADTPVVDLHTHLYDAGFGDLMLWGPDEMLTYHYLISELLRAERGRTSPAQFYAMSRREQADLIWQRLFLDASPISEACRGPLTVFHALGLDVSNRSLDELRGYFADRDPEEYTDHVLQTAGVTDVVMTNDPLDPHEVQMWEDGVVHDIRFHAGLRLDAIICQWAQSQPKLAAQGYDVTPDFSGRSAEEVMRFLRYWREKMDPLYMAVSLPDDFRYPADSLQTRIVEQAILPLADQDELPLALMIGVIRAVNPPLLLAGDGMGISDVRSVERMCEAWPSVRFLVTMLAQENQHGLCVAARKFPNLMPFGCWWFVNNPSLIERITRMRTEMLGLGFIPQHSDARILDQLIYKWSHFREILAEVLVDKYADLMRTGWQITAEEIQRDVSGLCSGNFWQFVS